MDLAPPSVSSLAAFISSGLNRDYSDDENPIEQSRTRALMRTAHEHVEFLRSDLYDIAVPEFPELTMLPPDEDPITESYLHGR